MPGLSLGLFMAHQFAMVDAFYGRHPFVESSRNAASLPHTGPAVIPRSPTGR